MGKRKKESAADFSDASPPDWTIPTPEWLLLMEIKAGYHRALKSKNAKRIASSLKAWQDFLRVPRKKVIQ